MATAAKFGPQDMPPPGGYGPIPTERTKVRTFFTAKRTISGWLLMTSIGVITYMVNYYENKRDDMEMKSARFALTPMLIAERDREYLKNVRKNREYERELMKDVKDWKVGTYYGEPIYKTLPKDELIDQQICEYFNHTNEEVVHEIANRRHWL